MTSLYQTSMDKLKEEIEAHIDKRHRELLAAQDALFSKLQKELHGGRQLFSQPPAPGGLFEPGGLLGGHQSFSQPLAAGGLIGGICASGVNDGSCCTSCPPSQIICPNGSDDSVNEEFECLEDQLRGAKTAHVPVIRRRSTDMALQVLTSQDSNIPGDYQKSEGASPETPTEQLGPKGQFKGRANLFAFLQCKKWDSDFAQVPELAIAKLAEKSAEPTQNGCVQRIGTLLNATATDMIIGFIILANTVVMGFELEYQGVRSAESIGVGIGEYDNGDWAHAAEIFLALEHTFTILYTMELILRLIVMGCSYFKVVLNWIDFVVVCSAVFELYVIPLFQIPAPDLSLMKLMRITRIVRILRILKAFRSFHQLRNLVSAVVNSFWSLIWSVTLLAIVQIVGSIFMAQSLQGFLQDESADAAIRETIYMYFGNWSRSFITMFEISIWGGTWGRCGRVVIFSVSRNYAIFFVFYLIFVSFALVRVIGALFLKDTLASAAKEDEEEMQKGNRKAEYVALIWDLFQSLDLNHNNTLSFSELRRVLQQETVCKKFRAVGVAPAEIPAIFTLMDDGDDEVTFCEFLTGIMRLKNASKGVDLPTMLYENKKLLKRVLAIGDRVDELQQDFHMSCKRRA
eukprot:gnl/MRDRNA2_/MRDRNA2_82014_c0_seq1.p1 gnl/MRDRNA2_/MRDRNA2_82014_c0~~gnl/MRDRNA2_/MRDRNA2_82014_c0_seq1.p1  ORF type:complete len:628 (-),score=82.75 gnl/MRDRNA2_/MRDRNA2_82014_c0_seq1:27-1910(-)